VSLDGVGCIHDRIRGRNDAFARASETLVRSVELAQNLSAFRPHINCTISKGNYETFDMVVQYAKVLGVGMSVTLAATNDLYLGNSRYDQFRLGEQEQVVLAGKLNYLYQDQYLPLTERHYIRMLMRMLSSEKRSSACVFQSAGVFLDCDGCIYPCGTASGLAYATLPTESFDETFFSGRGDYIRSQLLTRFCCNCPSNSYYGLAPGIWLEVLRWRRSRNLL